MYIINNKLFIVMGKFLENNYADLLNESKKNKNLPSIVLLSTTGLSKKDSHNSVQRFMEQAEAQGFQIYAINPTKGALRKTENGKYILQDNITTAEVLLENTVIIPRRTVLKNDESKSFLKKLEDKGFFIMNTLDAFEKCENKYSTYLALEKDNVSTPKTEIINSDTMYKLEEKVNAVSGGTFPVICKILNGTQGIGVFIIDSMESLKSTLPAMFALAPNSSVLIQQKINSDGDLRIHVLYDSFNKITKNKDKYIIIGAMKRNMIKDDFRSNFSLGGTVEKVTLTDEQIDLAKQAAIATGCRWCGVDIITDQNMGKSYVIEVNSSPGTKGISTVADVDIVQVLLDKFRNFEYFRNYKNIIGKYESGSVSFKCESMNGNVSADIAIKFDNTYKNNVILSDSINVSNNIVQFKLDGTLYTSDVYASRNGSPIIKASLNFNDNTYKSVYFEVTYSEKDKGLVLGEEFLDSYSKDCHISEESWILTDKPENLQ